METGIRSSHKVIVVCTSNDVSKANDLRGGAGLGKQIVSSEVMRDLVAARAIPILREQKGDPMPTFLSSRFYVDFRDSAALEGSVEELVLALHDRTRHARPPLGKRAGAGAPAG